MTGMPQAPPSGFRALVAAATAIEARNPCGLADALQLTAHDSILTTATRHRCLGYLRRGILVLGLRDERAATLTHSLRDYASKAAMQAYAVRLQLDEVVATLKAKGVPFALLKGAARLFRGDREAECDTMFDLDVLVPKAELPAANAALRRVGYSPVVEGYLAKFYDRIHHAPPLRPKGLGLPVELHFQLAPPARLSIATDWDACESYLERVKTGSREATCFNALGTAVNLMVHGVGLRRLRDVIMLGRILRDAPGAREHLEAVIALERRQAVALRAVTVLAARIAALGACASEPVERYLDWVRRREELSPYVRQRTQFVDAWYTNGGKLFGPATRLAFPTRAAERSALTFGVNFSYRLIGRIAVGAYAAARNKRAATR